MSAATLTLSSPLKLGPLTLKTRNVMASLTRNRSLPTNVPNKYNVEYYRQRAAGGAGLILSEGTLVSPQGTEWPNAPGIWSQEQVAGWKKVTDAVHSEGGLIFCQLWHLGRVSHPDMPEQQGKPVYGPSALAARGGKFRQLPGAPGYVTPTPVEDPEIFLPLYKQAAINAKEAGFDGVELHSANGYLIHQFLDNTSNNRTDKWGGSVENRTRLGLQVLKILVDVWGSDRVGVKINPTGGYNDMGMPLDDTVETFSYYIKKMEELKLAYIQLVRYVPMFDIEIDGKKRGTQHDVLATYKPLITHAKIFVNGEIGPEDANTIISSGQADAVVAGRAWLTHPDYQKRAEAGHPLDNQPNYATFYNGTEEDPGVGYTDYPAYRATKA